MPDVDEQMLAYFAARQHQRDQAVERAWETLQADVAGFFEQYAGHDALPFAVAKLVREMTVAAFVRGTMHAAGTPFHEIVQPSDPMMLYQARETVTSMPDIYRTWALLDGRLDEETDDA
ncbi:hypothetical protein Caci_2979 [Catenulispora acidiphila DSM 44928]|uniref:Uncharacterized protein n=1 Tax=Catenulispora acidiphila (strain DSM 44928 / JCM 14897 / NBRC 102108 / NRRL B-24433 / ID139908) TaxID=479433 RepID=C7Q2Z6_CATAD|nr:hypothetical protein [Catenulispora acidiphila]ACU71888.1 hypothetical protein Caci_2979 [Catenulispora acidiphila DSM 44928]